MSNPDEEGNFNPKKPTVAMFIILVMIILAVLLIEWVFYFIKARI